MAHLKKNADDLYVWNTYHVRRNWPDNIRPMVWEDIERVESIGVNVETNETVVMPTIDKNEKVFFAEEKSHFFKGIMTGVVVVIVFGGILSILQYYLL